MRGGERMAKCRRRRVPGKVVAVWSRMSHNANAARSGTQYLASQCWPQSVIAQCVVALMPRQPLHGPCTKKIKYILARLSQKPTRPLPKPSGASVKPAVLRISFTARFLPGLIDISVGSLDNAEALKPTLHYWYSKHLSWAEFADNLPRHPELPPLS